MKTQADKIQEVLGILMESPLYFDLTLDERLELVLQVTGRLGNTPPLPPR